MFYTQLFRTLALSLGLALLVGGCVQPSKEVPQHNRDIFKKVLPITQIHLENENYKAAYRSVLMEQNKLKPTSLQEVAAVAEIRSFVAKVALESALEKLRTYYYQGEFNLAERSAEDANFVCEIENLDRPVFLQRLNLLLIRGRQELYNIERDPPELWKIQKS